MQKKDINEAVRRLVDVYSPLEIYSVEETPDFAFIIIVEGSWQQPLKRSIAGKYALWGLESPKDIIVFTKDEFEQRIKAFHRLLLIKQQTMESFYMPGHKDWLKYDHNNQHSTHNKN